MSVRAEPPSDDWIERELSPDGRVLVEYFIQTQRMSHETRTPRITDVATGEVLLQLDDSLFDGSVSWVGAGGLSLSLRHYALGGGIEVHIDPARRTWSIAGQDSGELPLAIAAREIPKRYRVLRETGPKARPAQSKRGGTLGVILGALLLIAAVATGSWYFSRPAPQHLTPLPTFPAKS
jgi:hypothetical protein